MNGNPDYIALNLSELMERIAGAAKKVNRKVEDITLVAVCKTFSLELVREAFNLGITNFGENYLQEALPKIEALKINARWHFIGHLQKNKVRQAVRNFNMIQSVDSMDLLARIDRIAGEEEKIMEILLQVNVAGEERKSGIKPEMVEKMLLEASNFHNVRIRGLMLIPPFYENPEENRANFSTLRKISEDLDRICSPAWENRYLSMGMTDDFEIAIEEGSNMIRIGRAIFGPRRRE